MVAAPQRVEFELRDSVALVRFVAGDNSFNPGLLDAIDAAFDRAEAEGAGALVTTGSGRCYSTGLDLAWLSGDGRAQAGAFLARVQRLFARVLTSPLFTVAAIGGHAFAAGAMLALAHDVRVMREDRGYFCLPEIDLATGQPLTPGMVALIAARLPRQSFQESIVTGRRYGGAQAAALGIVQHVVPENEVIETALSLASEQSDRDSETRSALKRGLYHRVLKTLEAPLPGFD